MNDDSQFQDEPSRAAISEGIRKARALVRESRRLLQGARAVPIGTAPAVVATPDTGARRAGAHRIAGS